MMQTAVNAGGVCSIAMPDSTKFPAGGARTCLSGRTLQRQGRRISPESHTSSAHRRIRIVVTRSAVHHQAQQVEQRADYAANATDKPLLQQHPGTPIDARDATNCFDYPRNLHDKYHLLETLGAGGFGQVYRAVSVETGQEYACKSIPKLQAGARHVTPHHLLRIRGEVDAMRQLGASLDATALKEVFEDDAYVHLITELCRGGPVLEGNTAVTFPEREVAHVMRSVLRFLAQCAAKGVVYRDVKPANFLYTDNSPSRRVKATDFGLAVQHDVSDPPLTAVTGTTFFLAPEVLHKQYGSQADVYSAGVMAFQLLTGRYPYWPASVDSLGVVAPEDTFAKITQEEIDFSKLSAEGVSLQAQDFLKQLLIKEPSQRPTAAQALEHPFLQSQSATSGAPSPAGQGGTAGVVQALQRFGVSGAFRQVVLCMVAEELMAAGCGDLLQRAASSPDLLDKLLSSSASSISTEDVMAEISSSASFDLTSVEIAQLTSHMDVSNDGRIDRIELLSSLINWETVAEQEAQQWEHALARVFARLDRNADGCLCVSDLEAHLAAHHATSTASMQQQQARNMLRDVDLNNDGCICWPEFHEALSPGGRAGMMPALHHFDSREQGH